MARQIPTQGPRPGDRESRPSRSVGRGGLSVKVGLNTCIHRMPRRRREIFDILVLYSAIYNEEMSSLSRGHVRATAAVAKRRKVGSDMGPVARNSLRQRTKLAS